MDIKRAKLEIENAVRAYLETDADGEYLIPPIRQRPLLLMGPPGIGKTQIMQQAARDCGVALVAYTITHHTRQSAVGLPFIRQKNYGGHDVSVTEYTMSEIIASVYQCIQDTGLHEGILFIDEINCVSETLAPTMLQFLQCKTFGNQALPQGWVVVAAGNPPEYNRSVRDFDIVTLDRVKRMDIAPDLNVWREYARGAGIFPAILAYLELHPEHFYRITADVDGPRFVTARGWEDLSQFIQASIQVGAVIDEQVVRQYLQDDEIAQNFAAYLDLYLKYQDDYGVEEILGGTVAPAVYERVQRASFDERLSLVSLLLAALNRRFILARFRDQVADESFALLKRFKARLDTGADACQELDAQIARWQDAFEQRQKAHLAGREEQKCHTACATLLAECRAAVEADPSAGFEPARACFAVQAAARQQAVEEAAEALEAAFDFVENAFERGQEMVVFLTELSLGPVSGPFLTENPCTRFTQYSQDLLLDGQRADILRRLDNAEQQN